MRTNLLMMPLTWGGILRQIDSIPGHTLPCLLTPSQLAGAAASRVHSGRLHGRASPMPSCALPARVPFVTLLCVRPVFPFCACALHEESSASSARAVLCWCPLLVRPLLVRPLLVRSVRVLCMPYILLDIDCVPSPKDPPTVTHSQIHHTAFTTFLPALQTPLRLATGAPHRVPVCASDRAKRHFYTVCYKRI
jgi:hypothetical protein